MFGQGRGGRGQSVRLRDIFAMFNEQHGGRFGSRPVRPVDRRLPRLRRPDPRRRRHGATTIDFITATKGETITLQGEDGKPFKVKIPAGVADGQKIRLRGKGHPSPDGGETGDIVVQVTVRPHPVFTRDGLNLRVTVPVTFTEAALGATIEVPTLGGDPVKLRVAPGTPSGRVLRVKGRGVADAEGHRRPARRGAGRGAVAPRRGGARSARAVPRARARRRTRAPTCSPKARATSDERWTRSSPIFAIAVAAELAGMHPQTLRQYDRLGLVSPARTAGGSRRYSLRHVEQLREVARLSSEGMSLAGIARILELEDQVASCTSACAISRSMLADEMLNRPGRRVFAAGSAGDVVSLTRRHARAPRERRRRLAPARARVGRRLSARKPKRVAQRPQAEAGASITS